MLSTKGFTLIKLMIAIAILAILVTIGVPSYQNLILDNKRNSNIFDLMGYLNYARSEANKRSRPVSICQSTDGANCVTSGTDWNRGWIIFVDGNACDGVLDSGEEILKVKEDHSTNGSFVSKGFTEARVMGFKSNGMSCETGDVLYCDSRGDSSARELAVSIVGKVQIISDNLTNSCN